MNFRLKEGVRTLNTKIETVIALMQTSSIYEDFGISGGCVVTSLTEGRHSETSLHYYGYAADIRTSSHHLGDGGVPDDILPELVDAVRDELEPSGWQVIYEHSPPHIHIELQLDYRKE